MNDEVRRLADAVLYEGHVLWPYRRSSPKNRDRWTFGGIYPRAYARATSDRSEVRTECLAEGDDPTLDVELRFLHAVHRQAAAGEEARPVDQLGGYLTWDETTERSSPEEMAGRPIEERDVAQQIEGRTDGQGERGHRVELVAHVVQRRLQAEREEDDPRDEQQVEITVGVAGQANLRNA